MKEEKHIRGVYGKKLSKKFKEWEEDTELMIFDHSEKMEIFLPPENIPYFICELIDDIQKFVHIGSNGYSVQVTNSVNDIATPLEKMGYYVKPIYDIINIYVSRLNESLNENTQKD